MKRKLYITLMLASVAAMPVIAQDDMLKSLQQETAIGTHEKAIATFKASKIINLQSSETVKRKNLEFRISHLFGNMGEESGGGIHTLYGFDQSNDIRIAFTYGITDRLNVAFSRFKRDENLEGEIKYKLLEQTTDNKMPLTMTLFANMAYTPKEDPGNEITKSVHRLSYVYQLILAHKFSSSLSLELLGSYLHRNLVDPGDDNGIMSVGGGGRWKFTRSASIIADYLVNVGRPDLVPERTEPLGVGLEVETGGHVFTLMFTNACGLLENDYIANTADKWSDGGFKFSFHITRMFTMAKAK
jgi:hypothetical protein